MFYIGILIDLAEGADEKALSALSFLNIYSRKDNQILGVIELNKLEEWKEIEETFQNFPEILGYSILSSFYDPKVS